MPNPRNTLLGGDTPSLPDPEQLGLRPLSARSVVLSVLLGSHPPRLPIAALIALAAEFGIAAGTVRTAVSRMVAAGELVAHDNGYELAGRLLDRQRAQDIGRSAPDARWNGDWWVVTALSPRRTAATRREFRSVMEGAKLGELRPETWMRPTNLVLDVVGPELIVSRGPLSDATSRTLVERLWDLDALDSKAAALLDALGTVRSDLTSTRSGVALGFTVLAACLRFLRVEPQLPPELWASSSAERLRAEYEAVERALRQRLGSLFRAAIERQ